MMGKKATKRKDRTSGMVSQPRRFEEPGALLPDEALLPLYLRSAHDGDEEAYSAIMRIYREQMVAINRGERSGIDTALWAFVNLKHPGPEPSKRCGTSKHETRGRPRTPIRDSLIAGMVLALHQSGEKLELACTLAAEEVCEKRGGSFSAKRAEAIYMRERKASDTAVRAEAQMWIMEQPTENKNREGTKLALFRGKLIRAKAAS